jgi:flagellar motility protein MotE (MotC chaperone)
LSFMNAPEFPSQRSRARQAPAVLRTPGVRLLPFVIFAAVCMLGFRIDVVVGTITHARHPTLQVASSAAFAQTPPDKPADAASDKSAAKPAGSTADKPGTMADTSGAPSADAKPADAKSDTDTGATPDQPALNVSTLSSDEIKTLQHLAARRDLIDKREHDLDAREGLMKAGEARIDGKIAQLHDLQTTIEGLLTKYDKQKQAEILSLVNIYKAMKPKDAAGIFNTLDMPILVAVVQNMKETNVAPIMALMDREKARALTEELSQRKQIGTVTE